ncbi:hypothetical protein C900_04799 [Fulvivirga imtechensis AK7]|uniref:Uncharacterized protein n=2 Tax=Fulvivirga TaxID=396811 RepID=L8JPZ0_9BACT|nr:hypothetical protein C900_04799 [Fulvivirga imtechensis AK7]
MGMVVVAGLAAIIMPLINSLSHPKSLIKAGIGVAVLGVLFLITYATADSDTSRGLVEAGLTPGTIKVVGACLRTMYVLFVLAIVGIVFSEINKAIR